MRVSKSEAASRLGVSVDTIERRLKAGELKGHKEPRPQGYRWMIELPDDGDNGDAQEHTSVDAEVCACGCAGEIKRLEEMVGMFREQIGVKDTQISELHVLLQQSQAALPAPKTRWRWWPWRK